MLATHVNGATPVAFESLIQLQFVYKHKLCDHLSSISLNKPSFLDLFKCTPSSRQTK